MFEYLVKQVPGNIANDARPHKALFHPDAANWPEYTGIFEGEVFRALLAPKETVVKS